MFVGLCGCAMVANADGLDGCVNSPENPSAILALIGLTAAGAPWLNNQIKKRRNRKSQPASPNCQG